MRIEFDKPVRDALARTLSRHLKEQFELEIGGMDAVLLLDFISETLGPHYYNQALQDARARLQDKVEALGDAFYDLEKRAKL